MPFSQDEKNALLALKGVGLTVIKRFEEIGIESFDELKNYEVDEITSLVSSMMRTSCWKNSPQAKTAVSTAIERAKHSL